MKQIRVYASIGFTIEMPDDYCLDLSEIDLEGDFSETKLPDNTKLVNVEFGDWLDWMNE